MMNMYLLILVCSSSVLTQHVLGNEYRNSIVTTTKIFGEHIKIYPGTPYDYAGTINDSLPHYYSNKGSASTNLVTADVDYRRNNLYFYDTNSLCLYRVDGFTWQDSFSHMVYSIVHEGISSSEYTRIAVDWVTGNVYWTDPVYAWIALQNGGTSGNFKILLHEDMISPSAIAVDPSNNYLFWSDIGPTEKIERSSLSGTDRTVILSSGLVTPISISVDYVSRQIVWVDEGRDTLEAADFNGENRRLIRRYAHSSFFDVAVFRDFVMTTDYKSGRLIMFNNMSGIGQYFDATKGYLTVTMYNNDTQASNIANPCENTVCDHICVNGINGPTCICHEGYILAQDDQTCSEDLGVFHRAFIQSNKTHICLMDIRSLSGKHRDVLKCIVRDGQNIAHFDIGMTSRKIIIADNCTIFSANIDGAVQKDTFLTMQPCKPITGLALDWRDNNIYFTDENGIHLVSASKDEVTLINRNIVNPRDLIIVPFQSLMIWISGTSGAFKIEKANFDGSDRAIIVTSGSWNGPESLTIDRNTALLYFIDGVLKSCTLNGEDLKPVTVANEFAQPHEVLIYKNYIALAERGFPYNTITTYNLMLGTNIVNQADLVTDMTDMKVLDDAHQPHIPGPCETLNGNCEQICIAIGKNRECKCEFGYQLYDDNESCLTEPLTDNFLIVTDWTHNKLYMASLDNDDVRATGTETFGSPIGVVYDRNTKTVTWTTKVLLHSSQIDGSNRTIIRNTENIGCSFDRLAIDHTSGNIYFTAVPYASGKGYVGVGVIKPNGDHKFLISNGVQPRAIALDPEDGLLFWTDHDSEPPFVKKANMDGSQIEFVKHAGLKWPNGLAIDAKDDILFITDGYTNIIHRCTYTGACTEYYEDQGSHLMDITLVGDYLYYTAWNRAYITKLSKIQTTDTSKIAKNPELGRLDSISYSSSKSAESVSSVCAPNNGLGPCSTFCLPTPSGYTCACEEGVDLRSDDKTCENVHVDPLPPTPDSTTTTASTTSTITTTSTDTATATTTTTTPKTTTTTTPTSTTTTPTTTTTTTPKTITTTTPTSTTTTPTTTTTTTPTSTTTTSTTTATTTPTTTASTTPTTTTTTTPTTTTTTTPTTTTTTTPTSTTTTPTTTTAIRITTTSTTSATTKTSTSTSTSTTVQSTIPTKTNTESISPAYGVIGAVVGGIIVLLVLALVSCYKMRKSRRESHEKSEIVNESGNAHDPREANLARSTEQATTPPNYVVFFNATDEHKVGNNSNTPPNDNIHDNYSDAYVSLYDTGASGHTVSASEVRSSNNQGPTSTTTGV